MLTRIAIADDHPLVLFGTRLVIEAEGRHSVVGEAQCAEALLDLLATEDVDLVVTDFSMPGGKRPDGQAMLQALRRNHPRIPVVLVTMITNPTTLNMAMRTGVRGLVYKGSGVDGLRNAVDSVMGGGIYLDSELAPCLQEAGRERTLSVLSPKELEVLRLYVSGPSITEIAAQLRRTVSTISRQRISAMRKLGISNDAELFAFAFEEKLGAPLAMAAEGE
ncbi:DNA-binding response regulator [Stenotrophomonas sp. ZAC14D1_NAIMI4_6]|uniref:response regulator transcription factor n=1 Tax=unclassified Stenotrophomonas maltophilia group TaxID=2961925 RepID=UPI000D53EDB2|nr:MULTISPECIES: response regulator transcription factor [unclassified Stenotrophomonas maltophilia group]AWH37863.1 DNA-binding response regulator [Stenotrophomonas sp. ZAC14D1_NAIMI4_6]AWH41996.1 DNA-binding response regulator [Stenotrophomonas sp. ZAC14D1_NAIMI4_1]